MGNLFSSNSDLQPNFFLAFGGLKTTVGKYIDKYNISDDCDEQNLAQVFIEKINGDDNLLPSDKISILKEVQSKINIMKLGSNSNNVLPEIKEAHRIIEKNRDRYVSEIDNAITKIQLSNGTSTAKTVAMANAANSAANSAANNEGKHPSNNANAATAPPKAISAATPAANFPANNAAAAAAAKKEANNAAAAAAIATAKNEGNPPATSAAKKAANAANAANSAATPAATSAANSAATPAANFPTDPDVIFEKIEEFEKKIFNKFFYKEKKGKSFKSQAKNETKQEDIFKFLKVLLLYKKLFTNNRKKDIDDLIKKYSTLCPKVGDTKCGLTKEKTTLGVIINTYNNQSEKIKELGKNIENKTSTNISLMFKDILPNNNANNKPVNNPNNKIKQEKIEKIWENIEFIKNTLDRFKYFEFPEKNNKNNIVKTIQQKFLDFIKFLLIFKKIIKNKNETISSKIDSFIKEYLKRCGKTKHEDNWEINDSPEEFSKRCKGIKTVEYERNIYKLINFDKQNNQNNVDKEFKELLENGWKNDEKFNKLKDEFNSMLKYYYKFLTDIKKSVNEEVIIE